MHEAGIEGVALIWIDYGPMLKLYVERGVLYLRPPAISTETTRPYTAIIPDMTTGMRDYLPLAL